MKSGTKSPTSEGLWRKQISNTEKVTNQEQVSCCYFAWQQSAKSKQYGQIQKKLEMKVSCKPWLNLFLPAWFIWNTEMLIQISQGRKQVYRWMHSHNSSPATVGKISCHSFILNNKTSLLLLLYINCTIWSVCVCVHAHVRARAHLHIFFTGFDVKPTRSPIKMVLSSGRLDYITLSTINTLA